MGQEKELALHRISKVQKNLDYSLIAKNYLLYLSWDLLLQKSKENKIIESLYGEGFFKWDFQIDEFGPSLGRMFRYFEKLLIVGVISDLHIDFLMTIEEKSLVNKNKDFKISRDQLMAEGYNAETLWELTKIPELAHVDIFVRINESIAVKFIQDCLSMWQSDRTMDNTKNLRKSSYQAKSIISILKEKNELYGPEAFYFDNSKIDPEIDFFATLCYLDSVEAIELSKPIESRYRAYSIPDKFLVKLTKYGRVYNKMALVYNIRLGSLSLNGEQIPFSKGKSKDVLSAYFELVGERNDGVHIESIANELEDNYDAMDSEKKKKICKNIRETITRVINIKIKEATEDAVIEAFQIKNSEIFTESISVAR